MKATDRFRQKKYVIPLIASLLVLLAALFSLTDRRDSRFIVFFSGSGMMVPVSEIARDFTEKTGIDVHAHFEGSAILRQYIEIYGGADLFMSGDKKNLDILAEKGFVKESAFIAWHIPSILIPHENREKIRGLNDLAKNEIRFVMANPAHAASGITAVDSISRHPRAKEILKNVVAYSSSTADSLRLFRELYREGKADAVIEWDIMAYVPEGKGLIVVPFEKEYEIRDSIMLALLRVSGNPDISKKFYDYFRTEGIKIFKKHGYNTESGK